MAKAQITITIEIVPDDNQERPDENDEGFWPSKDPDAAGYVDPDKFDDEWAKAQARMDAWERGDWYYVGVRAKAEIKVPHGRDHWILSTMRSPGIWGIESDSGADYMAEVFGDENVTLLEMLDSLREYEIAA